MNLPSAGNLGNIPSVPACIRRYQPRTMPQIDPAESLVSERLEGLMCKYRRDVATPQLRSCDFLCRWKGATVALHVKRLVMTVEAVEPPPPSIRALANIRRPVLIGIWSVPGLAAGKLSRFARLVREFTLGASIGEECALRDENGALEARCRLLGSWSGTHAVVAVGADGATDRAAERARRLLRRARAQYMPRVPNVVVICGDPGATGGIELAVLGTPVERWDAIPLGGDSVALGRANDGFFSSTKSVEPQAVAWLPLVDGADTHCSGKIWLPESIRSPAAPYIDLMSHLCQSIRRRSRRRAPRKS